YFVGLLTGIQTAIRRAHAEMISIQTSDEWDAHGRTTILLKDIPPAWDHVDGWISVLSGIGLETLLRMKRGGKPIVTLSAAYPELNCPSVMPDNFSGTADATRHLLDHGHTRIGFVGFLEQSDTRQRYAGYQAALRERG